MINITRLNEVNYRAKILHACLHWKNGIDSSLWPMAVKYAAHVYNQMPKLYCPSPSPVEFARMGMSRLRVGSEASTRSEAPMLATSISTRYVYGP
jgi:hypothetical protein